MPLRLLQPSPHDHTWLWRLPPSRSSQHSPFHPFTDNGHSPLLSFVAFDIPLFQNLVARCSGAECAYHIFLVPLLHAGLELRCNRTLGLWTPRSLRFLRGSQRLEVMYADEPANLIQLLENRMSVTERAALPVVTAPLTRTPLCVVRRRRQLSTVPRPTFIRFLLIFHQSSHRKKWPKYSLKRSAPTPTLVSRQSRVRLSISS